MTDQISLPSQITNDAGAIVNGARLLFFESGTDTPFTVHLDAGLTTPAGVSVTVGSDARPPQLFSDGTALRMRIEDASGGLLRDIDPVISVGTGAGASEISFAPVTGNSATNTQTAIENNTNSVVSLTEEIDNANTPAKTAGSSNAYTLAAPNTIEGYAQGQLFLVVADRTNTGAATLNVDGQGPVNWWKYDASGTAVAMVAGDIAGGGSYRVVYDGTRFVTTSPVAATATQPGIIRKSTNAENDAGTSTSKFPDVAGAKRIVNAFAPQLIAAGNLNGTGTPAFVYRSGFSATVIDSGTGAYTVAFSSAEPDTNYIIMLTVGSPGTGTANRVFAHFHSRTVNGFGIRTTDINGVAADYGNIHITVYRANWA